MESHDGEHDEYDREDIEHVENMLYANIHYNSGPSSPNPPATTNLSDSLPNNSPINAKDIESNRKNDGVRQRNTKRYWSDNNTPGTSKKSNFSQFHREKPSPGNYKDKAADATAEHTTINTSSETTAPKEFTPYVPFLQFNDSTPSDVDAQTQAVATSQSGKVLSSTNESGRANKNKNKKINPFNKKHLIDEFKEMWSNETNKSPNKPTTSNKRLNPFNALSKKAKRKKSDKNNHNQNKSISKNEQNIVAPNAEVINIDHVGDIVVNDDDDDDDDDDVIILPTQPPPLICVDDSSDEETPTTSAKDHAFTEPTAVNDSRRKQGRCTSPSSSIQSSDDFIAQNDQRNFGFESFGTLSDEDLCQVSEAVENDLRSKKIDSPNSKGNKRASPKKNDAAVFTPPKQIQKEKEKTRANASSASKSYEVAANSFAAVDVYESESSDMPDTIYAKGLTVKRKHVSDSDSSSSAESVQIAKSKRLRKRKCSGSAKESDVHSNSDSSSDLPDDDDDDDENGNNDGNDGEAANTNSYLVRGEALGKIKNLNKKKKDASKAKKSLEKRSKDDFMNKLTSLVVHDQENESEDIDELENTRETSTESVGARDIVEAALQRRTKKSKRVEANDSDTTQPENNDDNSWTVTDQVGKTDELNVPSISDGNDNRSNTDQDKSEETPETVDSNTNIVEKSPKSDQLNRSNESDQPNASNQSNQLRNESNESNDDHHDANVCESHVFDRELSWNDEMRRFYNNSWGGETFSLRNIRARMPRGFLNWMISNRDKSLISTRRQIRCMNCQHYGHPAKNCPQPPSTKKCYMCGNEGHTQPRCPNKICYLCGEKSQKFTHGCPKCHRDRERVCFECKQRGHRANLCPDKWRRYHSTTTLDEAALKQDSPIKSSKPKYCCICAKKGHEAEQCQRANQVPGPLSVRVVNYNPVLRASTNEAQNTAPKCTILTTQLADYSFNFGNDISYRGNSIYARFRRAVKLGDDALNKSGGSDVLFVAESNLHDTAEPPIEVYDDDFGSDVEFDNISSTENFSSDGVHDSSLMTIDSVCEDLPVDDSSREAKSMDRNRTIMNNGNVAEMQELDNKLQTLNGLKEKMQASISGNNDGNVSSTAALADFIPLTSNEPNRYEPVRSPSPVSADSTTPIDEYTDAKIYLEPEFGKLLATEKGHQFLQQRSEHFHVAVRLEYKSFGTTVIVSGMPAGQRDFHNELKEFFAQTSEAKPTYNTFLNNLPKNRDALIKFIRSQFLILESGICNGQMDDPMSLYRQISNMQMHNPSKNNQKQISKKRKFLNMILYGRYGLANGKNHLEALQRKLRNLMNMKSASNVAYEFRRHMAENIDFIFSDIDHGNYEDVIQQYHHMKRNRSLPPLNLDRRLLGLKINVFDRGDSDRNAPKDRNHQRNAHSTYNSRNENPFNHGNANDNNRNNRNRVNALPSSADIQLNVSQPSTSHPGSNTLSMQRSSTLDKWNY